MRNAIPTVALCLFTAGANVNAQTVYYVNSRLAPGGDGSSWNNAFNSLDDALANRALQPFDEIWVAGGRYTPATTGDERSTFTIPEGVRLYGGFDGTENQLQDRQDPFDTPSVIDGDISPGLLGDIDRLITIVNVQSTIIDGFVIQNAFDSGATIEEEGAGIYILDSNAILRNLIVQDCEARLGGGIAVLGDSTLTIEDSSFDRCEAELGGGAIFSEAPIIVDNCDFDSNSSAIAGGAIGLTGEGVSSISDSDFRLNSVATGGGGAIQANLTAQTTTSALLIDRSTFDRNFADGTRSGGAIRFLGTGLHQIRATRFLRNEATDDGGAIEADMTSGSLRIENCYLAGNVAADRAGGVHQRGTGDLLIVNSTIVGNQSNDLGAGVFTADGDCFIANSILWDNDNTATTFQPRQDQFSFVGSAVRTFSLDYCLVQNWGGSPTNGVQTSGDNPNMIDADGNDDTYGTSDDNPQLLAGSAAIDAGNSLSVSPEGFLDLYGDDRFTNDPGTADTGATAGALDVVDIGAAEFQGVTIACPGDSNADGQVDGADLLDVVNNFGATGAPGIPGDVNLDGQVDGGDLLDVVNNFGAACP